MVYLCFHFLEKKRQKATGKGPSLTNQYKETGRKAPKLDFLYRLQTAKPKIDKIYLDKGNIPSEDEFCMKIVASKEGKKFMLSFWKINNHEISVYVCLW